MKCLYNKIIKKKTCLKFIKNTQKKWKDSLNANKSESILFGRQRKNRNIDPPKFNGEPVDWKTEVKYLGVTLDHQLLFHKHTTAVRKKNNGAVSRLYPLLKSASGLGFKNGLIIYKIFIRPILSYASAIWGNTAQSNTINYK